MRDSFVFYSSFYEAITNLPDETQLELYTAICKYSLYDELPQLSPVAKAMFTLIKPNIDNATARYKASVENGKRGGRPQKKPTETQQKPNENLEKPSANLNVYVNDNVNVNVNENVFTAPTLGEVKAYCRGRGNGIDAQRFIDYYTANGWKVGKVDMEDWRAAVRMWEAKEKSGKTDKQNSSYDLESFFELATKKGETK